MIFIRVRTQESYSIIKPYVISEGSLGGHSQTTWTERHTYMVREMSTNVHVRYIHGQPFVHVGMNFSIFVFKDRKIVKSAKIFSTKYLTYHYCLICNQKL